MRIGTWNLQRGGPSRVADDLQQEVLRSLNVDIMVLTEPPATLSRQGPGSVSSPSERPGRHGLEAWITILGDGVQPIDPQLPFKSLAAVARCETEEWVVVVGSVLPWLAAPTQAPNLAVAGESSLAMFRRVLSAQAKIIRELRLEYPRDLIIWAGDFNQSLRGVNRGGSVTRRDLLKATIEDLRFAAWTCEADHAQDGLQAVDLICGPDDRRVYEVDKISHRVGDRVLSDHAGYIVEL